MAWSEPNTIKTTIEVAWGDETRAAIIIAEGLTTTSTSAGATISIASPYNTLTASQYGVQFWWQEDEGLNSGTLYPVKSTGSFVIKNTGNDYSKTFFYRAVKYIGL